jgi:hypothetical protein
VVSRKTIIGNYFTIFQHHREFFNRDLERLLTENNIKLKLPNEMETDLLGNNCSKNSSGTEAKYIVLSLTFATPKKPTPLHS